MKAYALVCEAIVKVAYAKIEGDNATLLKALECCQAAISEEDASETDKSLAIQTASEAMRLAVSRGLFA